MFPCTAAARRVCRRHRLQGDRVRVRRVEGGILLEPMLTNIAAWFAELDRFADVPFMEKGRGQPPKPDVQGPVRVPRHQRRHRAAQEPTRRSVRGRLRRAVSRGASISVSSVVLHELLYGVARSERRHENAERVRVFLSGNIDVSSVRRGGCLGRRRPARSAGQAAGLEAAGTPIGPYDLLIAAQALSSEATLVTANVSEFAACTASPGRTWSAAA